MLNLQGPKNEQPLKTKSKIDININQITLDSEEREKLLKLFNRIKDDENVSLYPYIID